MKDLKRRGKLLAATMRADGNSIDSNLIDSLIDRIDWLEDDLQFVERWVVHHGQKPSLSAEEALSAIQHYPSISEITDSYTDGKRPDTFNPYARIKELEDEVSDLKREVDSLYHSQREGR